MRYASVILLILFTILAIEAVPANKKKKLVRLPFRQVTRKHPRLRRWILNANTTSELGRRATASIALSNFQDIAWLGAVAVGNPPQEFEVLYDTGGGDTWFPDETCGDPCGGLTKYDGEESTTFHDLGQQFLATYGDEDVAKGIWTADDLSLGDPDESVVTVAQQNFGRCTEVPSQSLEEECSGIVGLAFSYRSSSVFPTLIDNMFNDQNLLDDDVISCRFVKGDDQSLDAGEIVIGAVETQYVDGDIQYTSIVRQGPNNAPDWVIPVADMQLAGVSLAQSGNAFIDTGASGIWVSDAAAQSLYSQVPGAQMTEQGWALTPPFPSDVAFVIGQRTFVIPAADLLTKIDAGNNMLVGAIQAGAEDGLWIIGNVFIKNHYLVFDFGFEAIGIGKRNDYA